MLSSRKLVHLRGISEKCRFSLLAGRHQRVKITLYKEIWTPNGSSEVTVTEMIERGLKSKPKKYP